MKKAAICLFLCIAVAGSALSQVPQKPSRGQIAADLVGKKLAEGVEDGWFDSEWRYEIKRGSIKGMNIEKTLKNTNTDYCVVVLLKLQSEINTFMARVKINYHLVQGKWRLEFVNSVGMKIVRTHKYDDCIQFAIVDDGWGGVDALQLTNKVEIELAVAGYFYAFGQWKKFAVKVGPHGQKQVGGTFGGGSVESYKVEFIERL